MYSYEKNIRGRGRGRWQNRSYSPKQLNNPPPQSVKLDTIQKSTSIPPPSPTPIGLTPTISQPISNLPEKSPHTSINLKPVVTNSNQKSQVKVNFAMKYIPPKTTKIPYLGDIRVLMVAEKPSISESISQILSGGSFTTRKGVGRSPVHEFSGRIQGQNAFFKCTAVTGHVYKTDFTREYQNWETTNIQDLFEAPVIKIESEPKNNMPKHIKNEAKGVDVIVLWLDCDREGENICFEVLEIAQPVMKHGGQYTFRSRFSAITKPDIIRAMDNLTVPNKYEALSVDARQEIDLKVGVAFTRFQTKYFQGKYADLDSNLVSYGPCQTPTLGFCVTRFDEIQQFQPQPFWIVVPTVDANGLSIRLTWEKGREFNRNTANRIEAELKEEHFGQVLSSTTKTSSKQRPLPLNTVELLKICSKNLGIGPHTTMNVAEHLYISGYISYPRTESSSYPTHFNFKEILNELKHSHWQSDILRILSHTIQPRKGYDAGDHPPITPMKADEGVLSGNDKAIYTYILQHFIASLMPDCKYKKITTKFQIGKELFSYQGYRVEDPGFTSVMTWLKVKEGSSVIMEANTKVTVVNIKLEEGKTTAPDYLSESDLITLMEKNGIGTDASIPTHINNIITRNYVKLGGGRTLVPTKLGIALVHGYHKIDHDLVLPKVRSQIELSIASIAKGTHSFQTVVVESLHVFANKFAYFVKEISRMDELFEASFSTFEEVDTNNKVRPLCGKCRRYMKYINIRPPRLYCGVCEDTYRLPTFKKNGGKIRQHGDFTCPIDNFGILVISVGTNDKSYLLCPNCYNNPTLENMEAGWGCNRCPHTTCPHAYKNFQVAPCDKCDSIGVLCLDHLGTRLDCNICHNSLVLPKAKRVRVLPDVTDQGDHYLEFEFLNNTAPPEIQPLLDTTAKSTIIKASVYSHPVIGSLIDQLNDRKRPQGRGRGGGRRGRKGGRRGRGGRRKTDEELKMSFYGF